MSEFQNAREAQMTPDDGLERFPAVQTAGIQKVLRQVGRQRLKYEIKVTQTQKPSFGPESISFTPSDPEWDDLLSTLKDLQAHRWNRNYVDADILGGSSIDVLVRSSDLKLRTNCDNARPDGFEKFWIALEKAIETSGREWSQNHER